EAVARRVVTRALPQLADLVHAVVGRAVDLLDVEARARRDLLARVALPARISRRSLHAVQRLGEETRGRGLAHPPRAGEEERVADAARSERGAQRSGDGRLTHDLVDGLVPPVARVDEAGPGRAPA